MTRSKTPAKAASKSTKTESAPAPEPQQQPEEEPTVLTGRLTRDPVLRQTKSGLPVTTIRIAVNSENAETTFHDVVVWKRTAEVVCEYLKKGRLVEVTGRAQERTWTDRDGNERTTPEVSAFSVQFVSSPKREASEQELAA
jgi:single-strand DNA-binding protein